MPVIDYARGEFETLPLPKAGRRMLLVGAVAILGNAIWLWLIALSWAQAVRDAAGPWPLWNVTGRWPAATIPWPNGVRVGVLVADALFCALLGCTIVCAGLLALGKRDSGPGIARWVCRARILTLWLGPAAALCWAGNLHDVLNAYNVEGDVFDSRVILGVLALARAAAGGILSLVLYRCSRPPAAPQTAPTPPS